MLLSLNTFLTPTVLMVFIFAALAIVFSVSFWWKKRRLPLEEEAGRIREEAQRKAEEILDRARDEARQIVSEATEKGMGVIGDARFFIESSNKEIAKVIEEFSKRETERLELTSLEVLKTYRAMTEEARESYLRNLDMLSKEMSEDARQGMARFKNMLQEEIEKYQVILEEKVGELQAGAQIQAAEYRKILEQRLDDSIFGVIAIVSRRVLGKTIDLEEHQQLVIRALEEAKKEGFFK